MQLAILLSLLATLASSELPTHQPAEHPLWMSLAVLATMLAPGLFTAMAGERLTRRVFAMLDGDPYADREAIEAHYEQQLARCIDRSYFLWLGCTLAIVYVLGWPRVVRGNWQLDRWPLVDDLVVLAPTLLSLFALWTGIFWLQRSRIAASLAHLPLGSSPLRSWPRSLARYLALQARHQLLLVLIPALLVLAASEISSAVSPASETSWPMATWLLPLLLVALPLLPLVIVRFWKTEPLPSSPLRDRLMATTREVQVPVREILLWQTQGNVANALVMGVSGRLSYVLLTDALVQLLSDDELDVVLRHELAHLRRWHLQLRMGLLVLPLLAWMLAGQLFPEAMLSLNRLLLSWGITEQLQLTIITPTLLAVHVVWIVGAFARLLEHDADLGACRMVSGVRTELLDEQRVEHFAAALSKLVPPGSESWFARWLHPSTERRIALLRASLSRPAAAAAIHSRVNLISWLMLFATAALLASGIWLMLQ